MSYDLPVGSKQAVRVQFRYGGSVGSCSSGGYNDRDDLVFTVGGGGTKPTNPPVSTTPPPAGGGPQQASYDSGLTIPRCNAYGSSCDSLNLLNGRGTIRNGNEPNRPNTLDSCTDGNSGSYHYDESIDKIVVRSGEVDGSGSGVDMTEGGRATIEATVYPWSAYADYADFYYTADATNPQWKYIGTKKPTGSGLQVIKMAYNLPQGTNQAVRVSFRYQGSQGSNGACSEGYYDDNDDLAFGVKASLSFTALDIVSSEVVDDEPKDIAKDANKRAGIDAGKRRKRASKSSKNSKTKKA